MDLKHVDGPDCWCLACKQPTPDLELHRRYAELLQAGQTASPSNGQTYAEMRINRGSPTPQPDFSQMVNTTCARSGLKRGVRKGDLVDELATAITHACANIVQWLPHAPSLPPDTLNSVLAAYQSTESLDQLDALELWILTVYSSAQVYQDYHGRLANREHYIQPSPGFRNMPKDGFDYGAEYREDLVQPQPETTPTSEQPMVTFDDLYCLFCVCEQTKGTRTWDSNRVRLSELIVACFTQAAQAMGMSADSEGKVTGSSRFSPYKMTITFDNCDGYTLTMNDVVAV